MPRFLEFARAELGGGPWPSGYERLLRLSGQGTPGREIETGRPSEEGAAVVAGARHRDAARALMTFLVERRGAKPDASAAGSVRDGLLADLLRAALIDSREELIDAWFSLEHANNRDQLKGFLCEPPPWPPASVAALQARGGGRAMTMMETLAGQIAPQPRLRSWLLRSWLGPARHVDGDFLAELARAEEGRLAREPRFRAWLRAEWTAWARQRYRRVARQARSGASVAAAEPASSARPPAGGAAPR
jgi:hypothetical protein